MGMQDRPLLDMTADKEHFFKVKVPQIINNIKGEEPALWGMMTVQHMIEHLMFPLQFVHMGANIQILTPPEKLDRQREFLMGPYGMPRNFKMPLLPADKLPKLIGENLESSKSLLFNALSGFLEVIYQQDFTTLPHPLFGYLNKEEWLTFQYKHFLHHFQQFGLVE
jgi:oxepin-CoA hydrolase/3-oxo-5,6-dehydrosuberyl-CoA semialdehyde dehydrogenase